MTRLQTKVYETEQWPLPDPRTFSDDEAEQIKNAFDDLIEKEREFDEPTIEDTTTERKALDEAVLQTIDLAVRVEDNSDDVDYDDELLLEEAVDELEAVVKDIVEMREEGAGTKTSVLVRRTGRIREGSEEIDLPGVESARESTTLSDFQ